jgi:biopolymer transport protein ExbD
MKKRQRRRRPARAEVILSPLIDCVFLLLIFFLVTSMIKRFERQIPVNLADSTSAINLEASDDSYPIGISKAGIMYGPDRPNPFGVMGCKPLGDADGFLRAVITERGKEAPVTVNVEKGTPFQEVIKVQDRLEILGFEKVRFRIRDAALGDDSSTLRKNP